MIKLLTIDVDGTLVGKKSPHINPEVIKQIQRLHKSGVIIVLATGRNYYSIRRYLEELAADDFVITQNGSVIVNQQNKEILKNVFIPSNIANLAVKYCQDENLSHVVMSELCCYADIKYEEDDVIQTLVKADGIRFYEKGLLPITIDKINKIGIISQDIGKLNMLKKFIMGKFPGQCALDFSMADTLEIYSNTVSKGSALTFLGKILGIELKNIAAIGDSENDLQMIRSVGYGIAMGNGIDALKEEAAFVTKSVDEDGVAYAISTFINDIQNDIK